MSAIWFLPLGVGAAGAAVLAVAARRLAREVEALERSLRPVPGSRPTGRPGPS